MRVLDKPHRLSNSVSTGFFLFEHEQCGLGLTNVETHQKDDTTHRGALIIIPQGRRSSSSEFELES